MKGKYDASKLVSKLHSGVSKELHNEYLRFGRMMKNPKTAISHPELVAVRGFCVLCGRLICGVIWDGA